MAKKGSQRYESRTDEALELLIDARDRILSGKASITPVLRTCLTACQVLGKDEEAKWIVDELNGYRVTKIPDYRRTWGNYTYSNGFSIPDIPHELRTRPMGKPIHLVETYLNQGMSFVVSKEELDKISEHTYAVPDMYLIPPNSLQELINGVTNRLLEFINNLSIEVGYGGVPSSIFEEIRSQVDVKLVTISPDATNKLKVSYENLAGGNNEEDWAQVTLGCRRLMKDVADALFPPQDEPYTDKSGKSHNVKDDDYKNRLLAFFDKRTSSGEREFIMAEIQHLCSLLDQVYELSNKGIHDKISKIDAHRCMVYTYLLLGDILLLNGQTVGPSGTG